MRLEAPERGLRGASSTGMRCNAGGDGEEREQCGDRRVGARGSSWSGVFEAGARRGRCCSSPSAAAAGGLVTSNGAHRGLIGSRRCRSKSSTRGDVSGRARCGSTLDAHAARHRRRRRGQRCPRSCCARAAGSTRELEVARPPTRPGMPPPTFAVRQHRRATSRWADGARLLARPTHGRKLSARAASSSPSRSLTPSLLDRRRRSAGVGAGAATAPRSRRATGPRATPSTTSGPGTSTVWPRAHDQQRRGEHHARGRRAGSAPASLPLSLRGRLGHEPGAAPPRPAHTRAMWLDDGAVQGTDGSAGREHRALGGAGGVQRVRTLSGTHGGLAHREREVTADADDEPFVHVGARARRPSAGRSRAVPAGTAR